MNEIKYKINTIPNKKYIVDLYNDAGWSFYTSDENKLLSAINNSLSVITAWNKDKLVGLIRAVGDGETIIYIQDIIVVQKYQRNGIGKGLVRLLVSQYPNVRQKVLLTDRTTKTIEFYKSLDFFPCENGNMISFVRIDNHAH